LPMLDTAPFISFSGRGYQRSGRIDRDDRRASVRERAGDDALAAREIEHLHPRRGLDEPKRAWDHDLAVIFAATLADELVVPRRDRLPAAGSRVGAPPWRRSGATLQRPPTVRNSPFSKRSRESATRFEKEEWSERSCTAFAAQSSQ
jgi:hypothetical protein